MDDDKTLLSRPSAQPPEGPDADVDLGSKFQILGTIGKGGMGSVLKVRHLAMDRLRAVKILHLDVASSDPSILERFKREATVASDLQHPNIVRIFDFDHTPSGLPYIAMELLEGIDLQQLVGSKGPCSIERTVELLAGVADALDKVHAMGIVHRDLKPANLFLSSGGTVKILDFGISHVEWDGSAITETGDILGTPVFMSPEQLRGEEIDHRIDVYALAAVAYELLTGHHAVEATNPAMLVAKVLEGDRRPAREHVESIPEAVDTALMKGMAQRPEDRHESATELIAAIAAGAGMDFPSTDSVATAPTVMKTGATVRGRRAPGKLPARIVAGIAVLAALAIAATLAIRAGLGGDGEEPTVNDASLEGPLLVFPADVDVPGVDEEWASRACAALFGRYLALAPGLEVISSEEARARLGEEWRSPSSGTSHTRSAAEKAGANAFVELALQGAFGDLRLEALVRSSGGDEIWSRRAAGETLDEVMEELTWELGEDVRYPPSPPSEADRARCGSRDDSLCADALMAEAALLSAGGLHDRMARLATRLGESADTRLWKAISRTFSCLEAPDMAACLDAGDIGPPPGGSPLSPSRKRLWAALGTLAKGEGEREAILCELVPEVDPLVSGIAATWTLEVDCPRKRRVICARNDNFLLRYECMVKTTMYDEPETSTRYYDEFSRLDLANPLITATFSMHPMREDVDLADRWIRRVRLRTSQTDPLLANSIVRIELAKRNAREAMIWARRSVNGRWREGQARLVAGKLRLGVQALYDGAKEMLLSQEAPAPYVFQVIVRPAVQPILIAEAPELARAIGDSSFTGNEALPLESSGFFEIVTAVRDGMPEGRCGDVDDEDPLAMEWLYACRDWRRLVDLFEAKQEQSYAARASAFLAADAYLELGDLDRAAPLLEGLRDDPISRSTLPASSILSIERLAGIALARGDEAGARELYGRFAQLWSDADTELPALARARKKIEETGGPTTNIGAPEGRNRGSGASEGFLSTCRRF